MNSFYVLSKGRLLIALLAVIFCFASGHVIAIAAPTCTPGQNRDPLKCLACNCYYEARGEPEIGQKAVTKVVMTRVQLEEYPDKICDVVYERAQFSWTGDWVGKTWVPKSPIKPVPRDHECYDIAKEHLDYKELWADSFYNPKLARPRWARKCSEVATIQNHRFMNCAKQMSANKSGTNARRGVQ